MGGLVGAGCGITSLLFYTHGIFVVSISNDMNWSRGAVQFGFTLMSLMTLVTAPTVGWLTDKYGARIVALTSLVGMMIGCVALSLTGDTITSYYMGWILVAILGAGTLPITWTSVINHWFTKNRGLALGITLSGTGIAASIAPAYASWLIAIFDWRSAYLLLGATAIAIALPIVYVFFHSPTTPSDNKTGGQSSLIETGLTLRAALSSYKFWILAVSIFCVAGSISGLITNVVPLLIDKGITVKEASAFAGLIGISVIIGRLGIGYLVDRIWAPFIAALFLSMPALGALLLMGAALETSMISLSIILIGLAAGAEIDLVAYLSSRYFGLKSYGKIYGVLLMVFSVSAGLAPTVFGMSFDHYGNYGVILPIAALLSFVGGALMLFLGAYPQFDVVTQPYDTPLES
jgi:MFS family permease|tara:strand:- start:1755 stop:2966 length:1212 start_codon:yes stop_codon:yes gene_type:complete